MSIFKTLRGPVDVAALLCAYFFVYSVGGSILQATLAALLVAAYGLWCFSDGANL